LLRFEPELYFTPEEWRERGDRKGGKEREGEGRREEGGEEWDTPGLGED